MTAGRGGPRTPRAGQPYDFEWFKREHFRQLVRACDGVRTYYQKLPLGNGLTQRQLATLLARVNGLLSFRALLPDAGGGTPRLDALAKKAATLKRRFVGKPASEAAFWLAQEIASDAFTIVNYMAAMCDEDY